MRALLVPITLLLAVGAQRNEADTKQYLAMIQQKVSQVAPKTREKHNVTVVVDIESSGHLSALRVTKSSGDSRVDESVLRAVLASSPFKPLPKGLAPRLTGVEIHVQPGFRSRNSVRIANKNSACNSIIYPLRF
jgi:TonB family protein